MCTWRLGSTCTIRSVATANDTGTELIGRNKFRSSLLNSHSSSYIPGEGEADGVVEGDVVRLRDGLDHAAVGDADLRDGSDAGRRGEQPPPPRPHHRLQVGVARDHDQDARTHVTLVPAMD